MLENEYRTPILADANVLIDYSSSGIEILSLTSEYLAPIFIPDVILLEAHNFGPREVHDSGITVIETPMTFLLPDAEVSSRLSGQDRVCLEMASANGWTCATNDKVLRSACAARGVSLLWGLELMVELVARDVLPVKRATKVGIKMHEINPRSITDTVLRDFLSRIGG